MEIRESFRVVVFGLIILVNRTISSEYQPSHRESTLKYSNFVKHPHRVLNATAVDVQRVPKTSVCGFKCVNHGRCTSYNVATVPDSNGNYECQLLATDRFIKPSGFKYNAQFNHYAIQLTSAVPVYQSLCDSSPCQNDASCLSDHESDAYTCKCKPGFIGLNCDQTARKCKDIMDVGVNADGVYTIIPDEQGPFQVYCDQTTDGGGWTLLQRRVSPFDTNFNRNWEEYRTGFGNLTGEFWLGNDNIHRLAATPVSFRVEFHENGGDKRYARYENFVVAGADDKYRWNMDSYSGDLPNAIYGSVAAAHRVAGMQFSTPDQDNDNNPSGNCASKHGSWWLNWCGLVNLNRVDGPQWSRTIQEPYSGMYGTASEMKVR